MYEKSNIDKFLMLLMMSASLLLPSPIYSDNNTIEPTPSHIEGLYYKADSPERNVLFEKGMKGTRLVLKGRVLSTQGKPIPGVQLDFWQADAQGKYDTKGFRLRCHQFSDAQGRYWLETLVPASYLNRAPHIHVSLKLPNNETFTTQLFFPNDPHNRTDPLYKENLLMRIRDTENGKDASFDFVLDIR